MTGFKLLGLFLGYPECCIAEFEERFRTGDFQRGPRKFHGTGFVPCAACNEKPAEELEAIIAENRICKYPFPEAPTGGKLTELLKDVK